MSKIKCPHCEGIGYTDFIDEKPCPKCKGKREVDDVAYEYSKSHFLITQGRCVRELNVLIAKGKDDA